MISHRSAAALHELLETARPRVELTTPARRVGCAGLDLRRTRVLLPADVAVVADLPVTSVARTVCSTAAPSQTSSRAVAAAGAPAFCERSWPRMPKPR